MDMRDPPESGSGSASPIEPPALMPAIGGQASSDRSLPGNVSQCSLDRKRRKSEDGGDEDGCKQCSCKKSQCLKLYCVCFASGGYCSDACLCRQCLNRPIYNEAIQSTRKDTLINVKTSFIPKLVIKSPNLNHDIKEVIGNSSGSLSQNKKGCRCKKSGCGKKYCDCFQGGVGCTMNCKCGDCMNPFGQKENRRMQPFILQNRMNMNPSEEESDEDTEDEFEKDDNTATNAVVSPPVHSPISPESSFQQLSSDDPDPPVLKNNNPHFFPKPISQLPFNPTLHTKVYNNHNNNNNDNIKYNGNNNFEGGYSIAKCVEVMNGMNELSVIEKSIVPDLFLDSNNREIFISLTPDVRLVWLRRKIKLLPR